MNLNELSVALNKEFQEPMSDMITRNNFVLAGLPKASLATDRIHFRFKTGSNHEAGTITAGQDVTVGSPGSQYGSATLDWSIYKSTFSVPKILLAQVQSNPEMIGQLFQQEIQTAVLDLADKISADLFAGDVPNGLVGLASVMNASNVYAGVDRSQAANAFWRGLVVDAAAADLSTSLLYDAEEAYFNRHYSELFGGNNPTMITTKRVQRKYKELFETIDYSSLSTAHFVNQANASGMLGRTGVGFQGAPIVPHHLVSSVGDTAATDRIYIMNPNQVFLATLTPNDDPEVIRMQQIDAGIAPRTDGLRVQIEILANQGETIKGYVKTYIQLVCPNPAKAGVLVKNVSNVL